MGKDFARFTFRYAFRLCGSHPELQEPTAATFAAHPDDANFHQYMHVVFRLRDQFGADITVRKRNLEGTCPGWVDAQMRLESHRKLH